MWRAHDAQLNHDVALKILREAFTADPDRLARFEREAKVRALLNPPNIASIYGWRKVLPHHVDTPPEVAAH